MVAASSIHKWIENFEWWKTMCEKYDMDVDRAVMMLEVRNDNWTEECIQKYCELLDYMIEDEKIRKCNNDNSVFFRRLFCLGQNEQNPIDGYVPYGISPADTFAGCSVANYLTVRLGDMAICPCHRTAYNRLLYGWFKVEDNQIVDIIGNNPQMATRVLMSNNTYCTLGCDVCKYHTICLKGCFGSQYEALGDPFYPIQNICDFFIAKYSFLINKYIEMGAIDYLNSYTPYYLFYPRVRELKKIFKEC